MICILAAGKTVAIAASVFTLSWTHSVERTRWEEHWLARSDGLTVTEGRIEGSGAGMEPPDNARLVDGSYVYKLDRAPIPELVLAASGATGGGWHLCPKGSDCIDLGEAAGDPILISWCKAPPTPQIVRGH